LRVAEHDDDAGDPAVVVPDLTGGPDDGVQRAVGGAQAVFGGEAGFAADEGEVDGVGGGLAVDEVDEREDFGERAVEGVLGGDVEELGGGGAEGGDAGVGVGDDDAFGEGGEDVVGGGVRAGVGTAGSGGLAGRRGGGENEAGEAEEFLAAGALPAVGDGDGVFGAVGVAQGEGEFAAAVRAGGGR